MELVPWRGNSAVKAHYKYGALASEAIVSVKKRDY